MPSFQASCLVLFLAGNFPLSQAFQPAVISPSLLTIIGPQQASYRRRVDISCLHAKPAGAFFNAVPEENEDDENNKDEKKKDDTQLDIDQSLEKLMKERNAPSLASQPSTINGVPTSQAGVGFGGSAPNKSSSKSSSVEAAAITPVVTPAAATTPPKPYVGIGEPDKPLNDVTKPELDDQGYTLYADEETGKKSRVFEALVDYPCDFTMKIVGANEGTFVDDMLQVVADSCEVPEGPSIAHTTRTMGKWISVTVEAPVKSAEMLYALYEAIDKDPRVKFKF